MTYEQLVSNIRSAGSFLCVGLDTDPSKLPETLRGTDTQRMLDFNRAIVDATASHCVAYKPNVAFYESLGVQGWRVLDETVKYLRDNYPHHFVIADAKRGDIGNTSERYARAFFDELGADALTVAPYMGADSVKPFLGRPGKWVVLLALTSNAGSADFQMLPTGEAGEPLWEKVIRTSQLWADADRMMYVVGATHPEMFARVRELAPKSFLLVPGIGAQGGSLQAVCQHALTSDCGLLVNSSRAIIYASSGADFAQAAQNAAAELHQQMRELLAQ